MTFNLQSTPWGVLEKPATSSISRWSTETEETIEPRVTTMKPASPKLEIHNWRSWEIKRVGVQGNEKPWRGKFAELQVGHHIYYQLSKCQILHNMKVRAYHPPLYSLFLIKTEVFDVMYILGISRNWLPTELKDYSNNGKYSTRKSVIRAQQHTVINQ